MEKKNSIIRIALIGPESTAKSSLSESLSKHYNTVWIKEYAREYLQNLARKYTLSDIETIAKSQLESENNLIQQASKFIFVDTELIIAKVWCEDVFNVCPQWIKESISQNKYDLYLLTSPDLPWQPDKLRENPYRRDYFFDLYKKELETINANYSIIKGVGEERLKNCINCIETNFKVD